MSTENKHINFKLEPAVCLLLNKLNPTSDEHVKSDFVRELVYYISEFAKCDICTKYILAEIKDSQHEYFFPAGEYYEDFDCIDGAAENASPIAPWIKKISQILKRLKTKVSSFSGTTESLLLKSIEHLEDLDKSNKTEKSPSVYKQIFIGIMLLIKIIIASI